MSLEDEARAAYAEELRRCPNYPDGGQRKTWDELPDIAKDAWRRNPRPVSKLRA
jgi:hypothetical protein